MEAINEAVPPATPVRIELEFDPGVNFAMQQNDVPVVKLLRICNQTDHRLDDLTVHISCEPAFAMPCDLQLGSLPAGGGHSFGTVDLPLSAEYLVSLTERVGGALHVSVQAGQEAVASRRESIDVLAYDEWNGTRSLPEILAAFVLPNHPAVEEVLARASAILGDWTDNAALSGYQSRNRNRVLQMAGAVYAALQEREIHYINPPASFESCGQKIRLPDRIFENRLGTCLDLAVLCAACLEQVGLFPLVVMTEGHAFAGVWLDQECFAGAATDEALRLARREAVEMRTKPARRTIPCIRVISPPAAHR